MHNEETTSTELSLTASIATRSRHYLAAEHLWSALHNARCAVELEAELVGKVSFSPAHRSSVMGSILFAAAFLEALVNEVFEDAVDSHHNKSIAARLEPLDERWIELCAESWPTLERSTVIEKAQTALLYANRERFDLGSSPLQDVTLVLGLRNKLLHFKPHWHDHEGADTLENRMSGRVQPNPFLSGTGNPWFPGKVLSGSCANWASSSCRTFASLWSKRLGVVEHHEESMQQWESP